MKSKKLTAAWPNDIEIQRALAQWLVSIKDMPGATVAYEKVRMLDSDDAEAAAFLFEHSAATSSGSSNPLDKILNYLQGNDANLNAVLPQIGAQINSYLEKPTPELANKLLQVSALSVEKFGSEAAAFALHGDVLFHTGKYEQAYAAYAQSLKLDPKTRSVWEQMLYTNLVLRNWSALAADGERAIDRFPNSSVVCYLAGLGQLQGGDKVLAEEYLDMALVLSGKDIALQSAAIASLGRVKYLKNDFDGAIANFEQSVKLGSTPPETYDYWGDALMKQNKANEAVEKWKLAVEKGSKNPEIKRKIEQRSL